MIEVRLCTQLFTLWRRGYSYPRDVSKEFNDLYSKIKNLHEYQDHVHSDRLEAIASDFFTKYIFPECENNIHHKSEGVQLSNIFKITKNDKNLVTNFVKTLSYAYFLKIVWQWR